MIVAVKTKVSILIIDDSAVVRKKIENPESRRESRRFFRNSLDGKRLSLYNLKLTLVRMSYVEWRIVKIGTKWQRHTGTKLLQSVMDRCSFAHYFPQCL
jgi:predicted anti-sigma-YlaC factor YlaD